jgi:23S rRNA (adenine2503-C2)-methyltransferase
MRSWCEFSTDALASQLAFWGFNRSHAQWLLREFYATGQPPADLKYFGYRLLDRLNAELSPVVSTISREVVSADTTRKLLVSFPAGGSTECVLMPSTRPGTAAGCLSSQIGCAMGCDFCASTKGGLERNLTDAEIVEQFVHLKRAAIASGRVLKTIVFMGMGEPMHNLPAVLPAIERICHPDMGGLGWRQVTVSTVGIVPGIDQLAAADLNVHLALSLHAPDDATRAKLVPMNRRYPVAEIMDAAKRFYAKTGRIVTIEYCLIAGVNDSEAQADLLAELLRGFRAHVNVIPYNPIGEGVSGTVYERPTQAGVVSFIDRLRGQDVVTHVRRTVGDDVSAACGQLRRQELVQVGLQSS